MSRSDLLIRALARPEILADASPADWDVLIRQARAARLLARLAVGCENSGLVERLRPEPRRHLETARLVAEQQRVAVRAEVEHIRIALRRAAVPVILLKGAAYVMADLPVAQGRVFADVDILVPKEKLPEVESSLMLNGWSSMHHDEYDQRYYRRWMHEIPPMRHLQRGTVIDVHHALLPETARIRCDSARIREAAQPLPGYSDVRVPAPTDLVLHSATHLFNEGELDNGLRDLADLDGLFRHFGAQSGFWEALVPRAQEVGLARPLFYALRYAQLILGTPVPDAVGCQASAVAPPAAVVALLDPLFRRALAPKHSSAGDCWTPLARWMLYVRGHWLRMPLPLLLYHLTRKALVGDGRGDRDREQEQDRPGGPA